MRNRINRKVYVGQTTRTIKHRFQEHLAEAARGSKDCPHLYEAFRKYGPGAFEVSQISEANSEEELNRLEGEWIEALHSTDKSIGYNITPGGFGSKQTAETKAKISKAMVGKNSKADNPFFGKKHTEEVKQRISAAVKLRRQDGNK